MYKLLITSIVFTLFSGALLYPQEGYYRNWDGLNPFFQPFNTTDFYGSGDVNGDTKLNQADQDYLNNIITGKYSANIRADVTGDGKIDNSDVSLLQDALNGSILPGWWNRLDNKWARLEWMKKMLALDTTDIIPYTPGKFECFHFASRLYYNFTGYNEFSAPYYSNQTIFNLPVMIAFMTLSSGVSHYANAILIGDNPLSISSWLFIEPQSDSTINPSIKTIKPGSQLLLMAMKDKMRITFSMDAAGEWKLISSDKDLLKARSHYHPPADNIPFCWNPYYLSSGKVLFERAADNLSRNYSIHIAPLNSFDHPQITTGEPLFNTSIPNRIIYVKQDNSDYTHLIWEEKSDRKKYYYGKLNPAGTDIEDIQELSFLQENRFINLRLITDCCKLLLFWLKLPDTNNKILFSEMSFGKFSSPVELDLNQPRSIQYFNVDVDSVGNPKFYCTFLNDEWRKRIIRYDFITELINPETIDSQMTYTGVIRRIDKNLLIEGVSQTFSPSHWTQYQVSYYSSNLNNTMMYSGWLATLGPITQISKTEYPGIYFITGLEMMTRTQFKPYLIIVKDLFDQDIRYQPVNYDLNASGVSGGYNDGIITMVWQETSPRHVLVRYTKEEIKLTEVNELSDNIESFDLQQNYPNPFNPSTTITFSITEEGPVTLKVFDILGREVRTLIEEYRKQGNYSTQFNAENLPSGIYTYKLTANGKTSTRKMLLLK